LLSPISMADVSQKARSTTAGVRRHQDSLTGPPTRGVHKQVANRPGLVIDEDVLDVADRATSALVLTCVLLSALWKMLGSAAPPRTEVGG
jgi:hypothetical protein